MSTKSFLNRDSNDAVAVKSGDIAVPSTPRFQRHLVPALASGGLLAALLGVWLALHSG